MKKCLVMALALLALASCNIEQAEDLELEKEDINQTGAVSEQNVNLGKFIVKASDQLVVRLEEKMDSDGYVDATKLPDLSSAGIVKLRRLFPEAGKFEERTRAAGLHKWYVAEYDEGYSLTKAGDAISSLPGVDELDYDYKIKIVGDPKVTSILPMTAPASMKTSSDMLFDDPYLPYQWHYYNNGSASSSVSGCDINVIPVWKSYTTGNSSIVVAVVDGGVDYNHEDLKSNMWNNPEKTGDSKYGYNFVSDSYRITAEDHGTHVAGTIAAMNNNGKGVCGVAGGNVAGKTKGVKIMSCQIFQGKQSGSGAEAIKWACDHGAVIAQNSWGYTEQMEMPSYLKAAVTYFKENAGIDEKGSQTGPMRGGLVVFAAGNEDSDKPYGTNSDKVVNVASVGADFRKAYYSCYGSWVDISAPGGDAMKGNQVLSTLPGDRYGYMQGTSMACPHVSGVAALILSKNTKQGYTVDALRAKLLSGATSLASFNPNYNMGKGLVNAYMSMAGSGGKAPNKPTDLSVSSRSNIINFSVKIPEDPDDGRPTSIYIYYAKGDFTDRTKVAYGMFYTEGYDVGDVIEGTISGLDFDTQYYVAATACDLAGNHSSLTNRVKTKTGKNNPPVINAKDGISVSLKAHQSAELNFEITEPDGHFFYVDFDAPNKAAVIDTTVLEKPVIKITGVDAQEGSYTAKLTVTDYYGLSAVANVNYTILPNHPPKIAKEFENILFNSISDTQTINAADYFTDEDGEELKYTFTISDETVVNMVYSKGSFLLTPMSYGYSDISITASDIRGEKLTQTFTVLIRDGRKEIDVYPNPVHDKLHVRTSSEAEYQVRVVSAAGAVIYSSKLIVSPFDPVEVDMSSNAPGAYTVIVKSEKSEIKTKIVKI